MFGVIEHARRFTIHDVDDGQAVAMRLVRESISEAAGAIDLSCPDGREKSLAWTALEEAMFWANAAIARGGK